jgi:hypothetical protein
MKRIAILLVALVMGFAATAQTGAKQGNKPAITSANDNVDDRMKGPNGEKVYIGANGGRYILTPAGRKKYIKYNNGRKKKKIRLY